MSETLDNAPAGTAISQLPAASASNAGDLFPVTKGSTGPGTGQTQRVTATQIANSPDFIWPYDVSGFYSGLIGSNQILWVWQAVRPVRWAVNWAGSYALCQIAPSGGGGVVLSVQKNGTQIGTITFAQGATAGVFSLAAQTTLAAGDTVKVIAPNSPDPAFFAPSWTFLGLR